MKVAVPNGFGTAQRENSMADDLKRLSIVDIDIYA